ncbi:MarR family transcriptional regulator [Vibrio sp. Of7-15]|uniref:MarR family winged helix-turn-helix transcriptional regulator n=1 Tax=Vibrio sp. Of7-15 TaxID=2724879 RepID=UPI001EF20A7D|nr:MarR family transcriptional regulator [Vibrio sp. Of7-15]MCG7498237.1 MarR family transcriptional regulator [Vibrio sp. Of7-15]
MSTSFDRQKSLGWLINVVALKLKNELDAGLKEHGLSIALWPTLMCLWEEEGVTQREIAIKSKVESSTTTRTIDKLVKLNLVERQDDPNSRRSFRIYLTDEGRALKDKLIHLPTQINEAALSSLNDEEQDQMISLLQKMVKDIDV